MVLPTFSGKIKQKSLWELPAELTQARRFGKTRSAQSTALLEDYVELIADLLANAGEARPTDIARRLGVSHATAIKTEEDPTDPQGKRYTGSAIWRTETVSNKPGLASELAIRADVTIPERRMAMTWSLRRNTEKDAPPSYTIETTFNSPADLQGGGIRRTCQAS